MERSPQPPHDGFRPLRLLVFYDAIYPDATGGVEHRNRQLAAALARRGHAVTLAGWFETAPPSLDGVRYRRLPGRMGLYTGAGRRSTFAALRLAWAALRIDLRPYDAIETANIPYIHVLALALNAAFRRRPLFVTWHEYWGRYWREYVPSPAWPIYAAVEWMAAQAGTAVTAVSRLTGGRLERRRLRGGEVAIVPNGIRRAEVRAAADAQAPGAPLVYAGRLLREKRIDLLLEAVALLAGRRDGPLLTVIGTGPDEARLHALAGSLGIADRVVFTGRLPAPADVWARMAGARLAVQPSSREGFGMFPLEAMAIGLPVVYCRSDESALPELVRDGREGIAVTPEPEALAAAIEGVLDHPATWERLARAACERGATYDWDAIAGTFEGIISDRLHRADHRPASRSASTT